MNKKMCPFCGLFFADGRYDQHLMEHWTKRPSTDPRPVPRPQTVSDYTQGRMVLD